MTVQIDIFALIGLMAGIILLAFLLPLLWQWKKTAQQTNALLSELHKELLPTLHDFREITERINRASVKIEKGSGQVENILESVNASVDSLRQVTTVFRRDAGHVAENAAYLMLGIKAASKVFLKVNSKKGD